MQFRGPAPSVRRSELFQSVCVGQLCIGCRARDVDLWKARKLAHSSQLSAHNLPADCL